LSAGGHATYGHEDIRASIHALHARLGSIHIAVTAVTELGLDGEPRDEMLTTAADESVRAAAELSAIGSLVTCVLATEEETQCNVAAVIRDVATTARLGGRTVEIATLDDGTVLAGPEALRDALSSLLAVVAGPGGAGTLSVETTADAVIVRISPASHRGDELPAVVGNLVSALGGQPQPTDDGGVAFALDPVG
jgi:hypothetical protein